MRNNALIIFFLTGLLMLLFQCTIGDLESPSGDSSSQTSSTISSGSSSASSSSSSSSSSSAISSGTPWGIFSDDEGYNLWALSSQNGASITSNTTTTYSGAQSIEASIAQGGSEYVTIEGTINNGTVGQIDSQWVLSFWVYPDADTSLRITVQSSTTTSGTFNSEVYPSAVGSYDVTGGQWNEIRIDLGGNNLGDYFRRIDIYNTGANDLSAAYIDEVIVYTDVPVSSSSSSSWSVPSSSSSSLPSCAACNPADVTEALGSISTVPNPGLPTWIYDAVPDGHIALLPNPDGSYQMYWAEYDSYRTVGPTPAPSTMSLSPSSPVLTGTGAHDTSYDNGGVWLMSVHRLDSNTLLGFYHAEHWWWGGSDWLRDGGGAPYAWKSIGAAVSFDNGATWSKTGQIITSSESMPGSPDWGGAGDNCVVWDHLNNRWVCFYQEPYPAVAESLHMAVSSDPLAAPGTWYKYDGSFSTFNDAGLGGDGQPLPILNQRPGANPSVIWNTHLCIWVMVWHGWDGQVYVSYSSDLEIWSNPKVLVDDEGDTSRVWYPTIVGDYSDTVMGQTGILYYSYWPDKNNWGNRLFIQRSITFNLP